MSLDCNIKMLSTEIYGKIGFYLSFPEIRNLSLTAKVGRVWADASFFFWAKELCCPENSKEQCKLYIKNLYEMFPKKRTRTEQFLKTTQLVLGHIATLGEDYCKIEEDKFEQKLSNVKRESQLLYWAHGNTKLMLRVITELDSWLPKSVLFPFFLNATRFKRLSITALDESENQEMRELLKEISNYNHSIGTELLLIHGADPRYLDISNAVWKNDYPKVMDYINKGSDPLLHDDRGLNVLQIAAKKGNFDMVKLVIGYFTQWLKNLHTSHCHWIGELYTNEKVEIADLIRTKLSPNNRFYLKSLAEEN